MSQPQQGDGANGASPASDPQAPALGVQPPPTTLWGILRRVGPGLVLAGSIVGSGELIATTSTGAQAGFALLWLIIIGCIIKVFVQVEMGRYTIISGKTTLDALHDVPGTVGLPGVAGNRIRFNPITLFWFLMFLATIGQLGGIVGGVGQAMAISWPLTENARTYNEVLEIRTSIKVREAELRWRQDNVIPAPHGEEHRVSMELRQQLQDLNTRLKLYDKEIKPPHDDKIWAAIIGAITMVLLITGRYGFIEVFSMILVGAFTLITIGNLIELQSYDAWAVTGSELAKGLSFGLPPAPEDGDAGAAPLTTALATFGIIGVGASELMAYPYWCLEKGYARWTGRRDGTAAWVQRARGWLRVMKWDAWGSMVLYTFATIAFYLLGAAVLHRTGLKPEGTEMIRTLGVMYDPVFGPGAQAIFLFGAFAVLYSTFFVANAANSRLAADIIPAFGLARLSEGGRLMWVRIFGGLFPVLCVLIYVAVPRPVALVLLSGVMQALLLPMLGIAALFYRYRRCDAELRPSRVWDVCLWLSFVGFLVVGAYLVSVTGPELWDFLFAPAAGS